VNVLMQMKWRGNGEGVNPERLQICLSSSAVRHSSFFYQAYIAKARIEMAPAIGPSTYESKEMTSADHSGDVKADGQYHAIKLQGDLGLALVGDERIPLTDEDVCCISSRLVKKCR
jgi:hypothetical protein